MTLKNEADRNKDTAFDFDSETDEFIRKYTQKLLKKSLELKEYTDEDELIDLTTYETMIIHFYNPSFKKCKYMNEALQKLSVKFPKIVFGCVNVRNCQKMCTSLNIKILPFLGFFKGGYFVGNLTGFENLGNISNAGTFQIEELEKYINNSEMIKNGQ